MDHPEQLPERLISPATLATVLVLGGLLLGAAWLRAGLVGSEQWPIRWLDVEGELNRTSASQIRSAAIGSASAGFFAADLATVRAEIEKLPWVARAEVSRQWPDALRISVREHRPVARWNDAGLFSDSGQVFEVNGSQNMQGLARLTGPESRQAEVLESWQQMRRSLAVVGLDIGELGVDQRGAWTMVLNNGVELRLGRQHVHERLERFVQVHEELRASGRQAALIDLRYTNGLSIRWAAQESGELERHG